MIGWLINTAGKANRAHECSQKNDWQDDREKFENFEDFIKIA
jgi:hypothetical protein